MKARIVLTTGMLALLGGVLWGIGGGGRAGSGGESVPVERSRGPVTTSKPVVEAAEKPVEGGDSRSGWIRQHQSYRAKARLGGVELYMLGDSATDFWENNVRYRNIWDHNLGGWRPGDFGILGDRTQNVLYRLQNGELDGITAKAIVLQIGTFNLWPGGNTPEETAAGIKAIVKVLKEKQPQAKILVLGIFPRGDVRAGPDIMDRIDATNKILETLDDGKQVKYLNINDWLVDADGKATRELMPDFLNLNEDGYQIWAEAMQPALTEWLGTPPARGTWAFAGPSTATSKPGTAVVSGRGTGRGTGRATGPRGRGTGGTTGGRGGRGGGGGGGGE